MGGAARKLLTEKKSPANLPREEEHTCLLMLSKVLKYLTNRMV